MSAHQTRKRARAAQLVADDRLTDEQIAAELGISSKTVQRWRAEPAFAAQVEAIVDATRQALIRRGIAERQNRVDALDDLWMRAQKVIAERAADPSMATVPGGKTGMVLRTYKTVGSGESATVLPEYAWDKAIETAIVNLQVTASKELGQWVEKREQSGEMIVREYVGVDIELV